MSTITADGPAAPQCLCSGLRWCKRCEATDRVVAIRRTAEGGADGSAAAAAAGSKAGGGSTSSQSKDSPANAYRKGTDSSSSSSNSGCGYPAAASTVFPTNPVCMAFCWQCHTVYARCDAPLEEVPASGAPGRAPPLPTIRTCADHAAAGMQPAVLPVPFIGLACREAFVTAEEEGRLVAFLDGLGDAVLAIPSDGAAGAAEGKGGADDGTDAQPKGDGGAAPVVAFPGWKVSQSGRRKMDFGPNANFKKRKIKRRPEVPGMPLALKPLFESAAAWVASLAQADDPTGTRTTSAPFVIAESSTLDYTPDVDSNLAPHFDDTWLWGPRVIGLSLLSSCNMTFLEPVSLTQIHVFLPQRAVFLLSGHARYRYMHGILAASIAQRRVSITMREVNPAAEDVDAATLAMIRTLASTFV